MQPAPRWLLPAICVAVFLASTPWFAGTALAPTLAELWGLSPVASSRLTSATQVGFIVGTLVFAFANVADRFSARGVFAVSAVAAAGANAGFALLARDYGTALAFRFVTGVALAGVYPVAMKLIASWYREGLGWRLGAMVAALTLGTAAPYLIQTVAANAHWRTLALIASGAGLVGGVLIGGCVADGPHLPQRAPFRLSAIADAFRTAPFRSAALAYFGHMWELYAVWSLIGSFVGAAWSQDVASPVAFAVVGAGALGCVLGGAASSRWGERSVAWWSLATSGVCCLLSPWAFRWPPSLLVPFVVLWGVVVVADSAQFSALAAATCPVAYTGSALTIINGIGYTLTVVTIAAVSWVAQAAGWQWAFLVLVPGPIFGVLALMGAPSHARRT